MNNNPSSLSLPRDYVPSGSSMIVHGEQKLLTALLGTCVGVIIFDSEAGIGGLLHLLLPEPTGTTTPWQPETYASSGLPMFIDALIKKGASKDNLQTVVAGGALFGANSKQDLDLDIGGRTADVVTGILADRNLPVIHTETGGYFGAQLELNTSSWEYSIQPILTRRQEPIPPTHHILSDELDNAISQVEPIPQVALKIMRISRLGDYHLKDLVNEIRSDQIISANILRFCNSSFIGARRTIDSLNQALVILGENLLLEVVMSSGTDLFYVKQSKGGYSLMRGGMFVHSQAVAEIAKVIAEFIGGVDMHIAYTAGLLHDIGQVVLDQYTGAGSPYFHINTPKNRDLIQIEKEMFGVDHQEVGKRLAESWSLPTVLSEAIAFHHAPEKAEHHQDITHIIHLANLLANHFVTGVDTESFSSETFVKRLDRLNLTPSHLPVIIDRVPWTRFPV